MRVFIFESNEANRKSLEYELESVDCWPEFVNEEFFYSGSQLINGSSSMEHAILIGSTKNTATYIRAIRRSGKMNPIIALCGTRDPAQIASLLNCGADDVVASPFSGEEILSRINSILRRYQGHASESVITGEIVAYFDGRDPVISGVPIAMSRREHDIFHHLALKAGKLVTKSAIYDSIYAMNADQPFDKVIDVYICNLRKKISDAAQSGHPYIKTIRGRGYNFVAPEVSEISAHQIEPIRAASAFERTATKV